MDLDPYASMQVGMRVVRGIDWKWGNQDNGEGNVGTVVEIGRQGSPTTPDRTVVVQWDQGTRTNYRTGFQGAYDLLLYDNAQIGGEGKTGRVVDIRGWDVETGRSVASVTWSDGTTNVYRVGHKGKVDLKCIVEASGGFYYKEHLPRLGKPAELQRKESTERHPFQHGDKVKCLLDIDILREMQEGHGGWNPKMAEFIGQTGTVHRITDRGDVRVQFNSETRWTFHPGALTKLNTFWVDDVVRVIDDMETVKRFQAGHGEWTDEMAPTLGHIGKVIKVFGDGDLRVSVGGQSWTFNPACLTAYQRDEDANLMTTENTKESKSTLISILEKLLCQKMELDHPGRLVVEAAHGNAVKVEDLVQKYPDKVDIKNQGRTALQVAAHLGRVEVVKILLQANANIDLRDEEGDAALHYAAFGNQAEVVHVLVSQGANANLLNNAKCTAFYVAVNKGFTEIVRILCEHNCDVNLPDSFDDTPLHYAITADLKNIIEILTEVPNIDFTIQNRQGFNLLHHAALKGNKLAIKKILARARQLVDAKKEDGFTALHLAALNNHMEAAEILIREGRCDVNLRNSRNQTPLHLAVTQGHMDLVQLLVREGSDVNAEDEDGDTAMHIVLERQQLMSIMAEEQEGGEGPSLFSKLQASGFLGNVELNVGAAIACYLAQEGADINYANHRGKSPLDLIADGRIVQIVKNFSQKFRDEQISSDGSVVTYSLHRVHTTPNTMTNLSVASMMAPSECLVCSELALLIHFIPCQHSIVCEAPLGLAEISLLLPLPVECSRRMKKCIKCQVTITKKLKQDSTEVECSPSAESTDQRKLMEELQSRYRQMEERITCPICIDNQIKLVFQCGHGSCLECSEALTVCPICRQAIRDRIQIFV
ncbi:E3 ubiquitin-protein ligase MIB2 isoform X5 [Lepidochelys kempii]|uniref:E3 ubiquitin-protein ligase MIB2 isoform X5 n=1 Tax=Lepidochelys kempii TaxID=8472 RepID=UPI003C6F6BAE